MKRLLVATRNAGKVRELGEALGRAGFEVVGLDALADAGDVAETGETFEANARLKAEAYSRLTDLMVLADDSGLEVDALGGAPGVHSARYGGSGLDDEARNRGLLAALREVPSERRTGRFVCVLALARAGRTLATFRGAVEGRILEQPRGHNGFGYDPLFYHPESGRSFAELSPAEKAAVSHRGVALASLFDSAFAQW